MAKVVIVGKRSTMQIECGPFILQGGFAFDRDGAEEAARGAGAVLIVGARQVGKTTLAREVADRLPGSLVSGLEARDWERLVEAKLFLGQYESVLVILDEIHKVPELFSALRGIIDEGRRRGRGAGRFLMLGSASIELLRQTGESLAGRIAYLEMEPFNVLEVAGDGGSDVLRLWNRGGFPGSYLAEEDANQPQPGAGGSQSTRRPTIPF